MLRAAQKLVPEGASIEIFDIDGLPSFNQDDEKNPPARNIICAGYSCFWTWTR